VNKNSKLVQAGKFIGRCFGRALIVCAAILGVSLLTGEVRADEITDTISDVSGYVTAAMAIGITVLLFVLGRRVVKRLI